MMILLIMLKLYYSDGLMAFWSLIPVMLNSQFSDRYSQASP